MPKSYSAILEKGPVRWLDEVPDSIRLGKGEVRVCVTIPEEETDQDELSSLLDELASEDPFQGIGDPVKWQRDLRRSPNSG